MMPTLQLVLKCATGLLATVGIKDPTTSDMGYNSLQSNTAPTYVPVNKRSIDATSWGCGRLDAFAIGTDTQIYHKWWDGPDDNNNKWHSLGGSSLSPPAAVSSKYGRLDVFHRGSDKRVWSKYLAEPHWSNWVDLDVFVLGGANGRTPYRKTMEGGIWGSWEDLDGEFKSELAAVSWGPGRIDVFAIGLNDKMYIRSFSGGRWLAGWNCLEGRFNSPPTAISWAHGRLDVFGIDKSGVPQYKTHSNGVWSEWESLGGVLFSALSATTSSFFGTKRFDIFALGGKDRVYQKTFNGVTGKWEGWTSHGDAFDAEPVVTSWGPDRLDVLCLGKNGDVGHQAWNGTSWEPLIGAWKFDAGPFQKFP